MGCVILFNMVVDAEESNTNWKEQQKIVSSDVEEKDFFGCSVAIDGDYAIIGANQDDFSQWKNGSAYIFKRNGETWTEQVKLTASDEEPRDYFGSSVDIKGEYAAIGAFGDDNIWDEGGSVYVFKRDGDIWTEQAKLTASDENSKDWFGYSVSLDNNYLIIGAGQLWTSRNGAAYVFKRDGDIWTEQAKLTASDGESHDAFGISVSIDGDYALIGADGNEDNENNSGSAYIFKRNGETWTEQVKLTASDAEEWDRFGCSVSLDGDYAIIGANGHEDTGAVYIFKRTDNSWVEQTKIFASDIQGSGNFGVSVSIDGDTILVGADRQEAAYIFKRNNEIWEEQAILKSPNLEFTSDDFGYSVSLSEGYALIGAYGADYNGQYSAGSAYIYINDEMAKTSDSNAQKSNDKSTPGFELFISVIAIGLIICFERRKKFKK